MKTENSSKKVSDQTTLDEANTSRGAVQLSEDFSKPAAMELLMLSLEETVLSESRDENEVDAGSGPASFTEAGA